MTVRRSLASALAIGLAPLAALPPAARAAIGVDYVTAAPPTVYESDVTSAQSMDFDVENGMFVAHSGWYDDRMIHYYKFRMYTPDTYPGLIAPGSTSQAVPIQKVYLTSTDTTLTGAVGRPIIEYHTSDGTSYSDFMELVLVEVPEGYVPDTYKSSGDVVESGDPTFPIGVILNMPVVPTGSTLQDPLKKGIERAPIVPVPVWYRGVEVQTFVFEVTESAAADMFAYTRTDDPTDPAYAVTVAPFATSQFVSAAPLWHLNQYTRGVVVGSNGGGPSPAGMRNVINSDRGDDLYSPLWEILWVTAIPVNFQADDVSNFADMNPENGFESVATPMFVNCPNVGLVGNETNPNIAASHETSINIAGDSNWIMGSDASLIMRGGIPISFQSPPGADIATTATNMMGAYEHELPTSAIPENATEVSVVSNATVIRTVPVVRVVSGNDYITEAPPTVYESNVTSPQNMDFDRENNMFIAHSGWYNGRLAHYYKFRMYTPDTYPGVISPDSTTPDDVPIQQVAVVTTNGTLAGAVGKPIIEYHTSDGNDYSDFMELILVDPPDGYEADAFRSMGDVISHIINSGDVTSAPGVIINMPVVPTDSVLQDPHGGGTDRAPITPVPVWYRGVEVHTYVFEVTDQAAADHFAYTRADPDDPAYAITVAPFAAGTSVGAAPLWHLNQYTRGVTEGANGGGPNPAGMRNLINLDRGDDGYSPLWEIKWVTALPINYEADDVSDPADMTQDNGFAFVDTPMFINCPNIGSVGNETNPNVTSSHQTSIDMAMDTNWIMGSDAALIMRGGETVSFESPLGTEIATATTNAMGGYEYGLDSSDVPDGAAEVFVVPDSGEVRSVPVMASAADPTPPPGGGINETNITWAINETNIADAPDGTVAPAPAPGGPASGAGTRKGGGGGVIPPAVSVTICIVLLSLALSPPSMV